RLRMESLMDEDHKRLRGSRPVSLAKADLHRLPAGPGAYHVLGAEGRVELFVGETDDLRQRLVNQFGDQRCEEYGSPRQEIVLSVFSGLTALKQKEALQVHLFRQYSPKLNIAIEQRRQPG